MRKPDLLEFIERVKQKAVKSVEEKWNKEIQEAKDKAISKYTEKLDMCQSAFNNFSTNLTNIITDMKDDLEVAYSSSYDVQTGLKYLSNIKDNISISCSFKGEVQRLKDAKEREIKEVQDNYHKVYVICQSMGSANRIAEYLEELGFDISSVKDKNMTALVAQVDKEKLFVCGDNK
ncbi:hypothetical protein [Clostridium butyricum]|uniref:hypothetical protein n=1 Tax=Clostridium butyricum TaxID=1492 RepID=UPI003465E76F